LVLDSVRESGNDIQLAKATFNSGIAATRWHSGQAEKWHSNKCDIRIVLDSADDEKIDIRMGKATFEYGENHARLGFEDGRLSGGRGVMT
jgi:hypothetical protein